jgi:PAS domain S-box-containing protein
LYVLENETPEKFKSNDFQVDRPVYFILEDNKHRFWFGTDNGVVRWDGKKAARYSLDHGLTGRETNRGAAIQDTQGRIWIGTTGGISIYDEAFDNDERFNPPPQVSLLNLQTGERKIPLNSSTGSIRLSHNNNTLAFHFRTISFLDETAIRVKSKLEGFEKKWSDEHYLTNQMIRYTSLPPGAYRFRLKAGNALGVWSTVVTSPQIIIPKPFQRTWWFYLLISLSAGFILYGIFRFFSEKRHAETLEKEVEKRTQQLHTVEKQYRNLFEESKDVVFMSTPDGALININPAGLELFGFQSKEEALAISSVKDLYYNAAHRHAFKEEIERKGFVKDYEIVYKRKDNEPIIAQVTATLVRDKAGKIAAYRGIVRDITDKKRLEQQLAQAQKMEAIGTLAGGIAHDFNNILGIILGYSELMLDEIPEENQLHLQALQIRTASERAAALVKQILAFSRQSKQERNPLKISLILKEALKLLRSTLPSLIEIRQDIRADSDIVLSDVTQVHQIIMNLGANAAHAMREKGGILQVTLDNVMIESAGASNPDEKTSNLYKNLKPGPYLRLIVSDTGHGIPPDVAKRIFDPFFTTKDPGEGTGMGLAVVHGIVKSHGGDISVYSEQEKGTSFHVYLPQMQGKAGTETKPKRGKKMPGGSERILLVDDEAALTQMGKQMLENLGYNVVTEASGVEALEHFRSRPDGFHLVISDVTMPRMSGIQLAKEIKHINPDIPIILCSGYSSAITIEQIKAFGISDFIMKPIVKSELARKVRYVLDKKK